MASGIKDIENRKQNFSYRGWVMIHAGNKVSENGLMFLEYLMENNSPAFENRIIPEFDKLGTGGFIGYAKLIGCSLKSDSFWHEAGMYGLQFVNAKLLPEVRPYRGQLGVFNIDPQEVVYG